MDSAPLKLIFMGTPMFAVPTLQSLLNSEHEVIAVYTQPPRPAHRGKKETPSPVQQLAEEYAVPVYVPKSLKGKEAQDVFDSHQADAAIVAAYGLLLPKPILEAPRYGCINVHPSRLPRWRGAAPIQRTIMAGDEDTAMCIMQMDEGLDTGDILMQEDIVIEEGSTAGELHDQLAQMAGEMVLQTLEGLENGVITPKKQSEQDVTYAEKISKEEARIDWSWSAERIYYHILGLSPFPGAWFEYEGERVKVYECELAHRMSFARPGAVVSDHLSVVCGDGAVVRLKTLQRSGKKTMDTHEFLRGFPIPKDMRLA